MAGIYASIIVSSAFLIAATTAVPTEGDTRAPSPQMDTASPMHL